MVWLLKDALIDDDLFIFLRNFIKKSENKFEYLSSNSSLETFEFKNSSVKPCQAT